MIEKRLFALAREYPRLVTLLFWDCWQRDKELMFTNLHWIGEARASFEDVNRFIANLHYTTIPNATDGMDEETDDFYFYDRKNGLKLSYIQSLVKLPYIEEMLDMYNRDKP